MWCPYARSPPFSSDRQHLSYDGCLKVRGKIIRTGLCCIVYWKLCTVISILWAVLTVLWIAFCLTGPISLCVGSFVFMCVFLDYLVTLHTCCIIVIRWSGPGGIEAQSLNIFLQCFDTVGCVVWSVKPVPDMTYNVFGGTLNLTQSINYATAYGQSCLEIICRPMWQKWKYMQVMLCHVITLTSVAMACCKPDPRHRSFQTSPYHNVVRSVVLAISAKEVM